MREKSSRHCRRSKAPTHRRIRPKQRSTIKDCAGSVVRFVFVGYQGGDFPGEAGKILQSRRARSARSKAGGRGAVGWPSRESLTAPSGQRISTGGSPQWQGVWTSDDEGVLFLPSERGEPHQSRACIRRRLQQCTVLAMRPLSPCGMKRSVLEQLQCTDCCVLCCVVVVF
jgi:hypothetical protein